MKYPTLQKVMLTTMALAASLALSAQAGQRVSSTAKKAANEHQRSQTPNKNSGSSGAHFIHVPGAPAFPQVVLYDQYDNAAANATSSQDFEASLDSFDDFLADDFVVPGGASWSVESIDADGVYFNGSGPSENFNVFVYSDAGGLPGALVASRIGMSYVQVGSTFTVTLSPAVDLNSGTYWISVQSRMDFTPFGQWGWTDRTVQSNSAAAWQNPGGGFGVCVTWGRRGDDCFIDQGVPDQVFRLNGEGSGGGTPTPTPTATPTATPGSALWYNGDFDGEATGNGLSNEQDTFAEGYSHIYDDFNATGTGFDIGSIFSNNLSSTNIISATWEIRSGVSSGNPGNLVASGMTMTPEITPTGRSGFGFTEFTVQVNDLDVHLDPGTYFLNVTPVDSFDGGRSFNSSTMGANCVGTPCGNNSNSFWDSTLFGVFFVPAGPNCAPPNLCNDFSMGVNGQGVVGGKIELTAQGRKVNGENTTNLHWRGATSSDIDVFRSQQGGGGFTLIATTPNNGSYQDSTGTTGKASFKYKVCEAGTQNCSNKKAVVFKR